MNGGKLWQDVDRHGTSHILWDPHSQKEYFVTSTHHQQMIPNESGVLVAYAGLSMNKAGHGHGWSANMESTGLRGTKAYKEGLKVRKGYHSVCPSIDAEVVWYPESLDLCFQPHPEFRHAEECRNYFMEVFDRYLGEGKMEMVS